MIYLLKVLFPYIILFYIIDGFIHVEKFHLIFYSHFGGKFKVKKPGIHFLGLSPFRQAYTSRNFPFFINQNSIYIWNKNNINESDLYEEKHFSVLSFAEIETIECSEEILTTDNAETIKLPSASIATHLIDNIKKTNRTASNRDKEDRCHTISSISKFQTTHYNLLFLLNSLASILFLYTFIILPFFIFFNFNVQIILLAIAFFYILLTGSALYTHQKIYKNNKKMLIFFFSLLLSPVSSIHVMHMITKQVNIDMDWIELAAHTLPKNNAREILKKELKRISFSKEKCANNDLMTFLSKKEKRYLPLLQRIGLQKGEIFIQPPKRDHTASLYCPYCETEFRDSVLNCPDCDIKLLTYKNVPHATEIA